MLQPEARDPEAGPGRVRLRGAHCSHGLRVFREAGAAGQTQQAEPQTLCRSLRPPGSQDRRRPQEARGQDPDRRKCARVSAPRGSAAVTVVYGHMAEGYIPQKSNIQQLCCLKIRLDKINFTYPEGRTLVLSCQR